MRVMIVESSAPLARLWSNHLCQQSANVDIASTESEAVEVLRRKKIDVIVLDLVLERGSAFAVADFARYVHPKTSIVFVTNTTFFSDGANQ